MHIGRCGVATKLGDETATIENDWWALSRDLVVEMWKCGRHFGMLALVMKNQGKPAFS